MRTNIAENEMQLVLNTKIKRVTEMIEFMYDAIARADQVYSEAFPSVWMSAPVESEDYKRRIRIMIEINDIIMACHVNIKSKGCVYIKDAVAILCDYKMTDLCISKDVYQLIADKYKIRNVENVEHCIRNAVRSAYLESVEAGDLSENIMGSFTSRPKNKEFLLAATAELRRRLWAPERND